MSVNYLIGSLSTLTMLVCPGFPVLHAGELLLLPQAVHLGLTVPGADSAGSDSSGSARLVLSIRFCPFLAGFISKGLLEVSSAGITAVQTFPSAVRHICRLVRSKVI